MGHVDGVDQGGGVLRVETGVSWIGAVVEQVLLSVGAQDVGLQEPRSCTPNPAMVGLPFWHVVRCECQRVSDPPTCGPLVSPFSIYMAPSRMGA